MRVGKMSLNPYCKCFHDSHQEDDKHYSTTLPSSEISTQSKQFPHHPFQDPHVCSFSEPLIHSPALLHQCHTCPLMRCPHSYLNCLYLHHRKTDLPDKQDNTKARSQTRVSSVGDTHWGKLLHVLHGCIFHTSSTRVSLRMSTLKISTPKM